MEHCDESPVFVLILWSVMWACYLALLTVGNRNYANTDLTYINSSGATHEVHYGKDKCRQSR